MRWLLFLSRLAFICGVFFLLAVSLQMKDWAHDEAISSTIILIGYAMGLIIVPFVNVSYLIVFAGRKRVTDIVPRWLIIGNFIWLLVLLVYIFYLNDPYYHRPR